MPSRARDLDARLLGDRLRAQLGQPAGAVALEARVDRRGDREAQDDVPQEREPLVGVGAAVDPRRVRERLLGEIFGELIEKGGEGVQLGGQVAFWGARAAIHSAAWPTVSSRAASSSGILMP